MTKYLIPYLKALLNLFDSIIEKKTGLSSSQIRILGYIASNSERRVTQKDIEREAGVSRAAISSILAKMEGSGLIERAPDSEDGRRNVINFTDKGRELSKDVYTILSSIETELFSVLSDEEISAMDSIKEKLSNKLEELRC